LALFGTVAVSLLASPAFADPRSDVMAGAQRCAGIADNRTWLDCFYGAAQPMRAILGLPPAPVNQQRLVPPALGAPVYSAPSPPVYAAPSYAAPPAYAPPVYTPPAVYTPPNQPAYAAPPSYGVGAQAYNPSPVAPAVQNGAGAAPPPLPRRRGTGFFGTIFGDSRPVVSNQRMESWTTGRGGRFVVTLADGQIWQQDDGDENTPRWRGAANRFVVNIYEGALGTYNMSVSDDSTLYKVHRVN
jgi:hypothetical protein